MRVTAREIRLRERVRIEREGDIAIWTITRPEVRNAFDFATFAAVREAIRKASQDRHLRAVVLTGAGSTFASGGDLRELRDMNTRADGNRIANEGRRMCDAIAQLSVPVIAALPGPAIGGGAELAIACDLRVADPRARLSFKHARMAVTTAWGVLPKLVSMVGIGAAARLLLGGHEVDAADALRMGLVEGVCEEGASLATALVWAQEVTKGAPKAVAALKALLREGLDGTRARRGVRERSLFVAAWADHDHREAVEAFFGGRAPEWGKPARKRRR